MSTVDRIKEACKKNGTTITALERKLGYSRGSIGKNNSIRADWIAQIAVELHVSADYLLEINGRIARPEIIELVKVAEKCSASDVEYATKKLKAMLKVDKENGRSDC